MEGRQGGLGGELCVDNACLGGSSWERKCVLG